MSVRRLTPPGAGAVAVLEVTGEADLARLASLLDRGLPAEGRVVLARLGADGETLDEALSVRRGDGAVELHLHGSPAVVRAAIAHLGGESRAEATPPATRAARLAPRAASRAGARVLLDQAAGSFERGVFELADAAGEGRAEIAREMLARGRALETLLRPAVVAITGPVNAGKSTLFNVLLGRDEALVSDQEGTTRDVVAGACELDGWPLVVLDTAGLRELEETGGQAGVEAEGMRRGAHAAARADVVLALGEGSTASDGDPPIRALTARADERLGEDPGAWPAGALSARSAPDHARAEVARAIGEALGREGSGAALAASLAGRCVPFEPAMLAALEEALAGGPGDARFETLPETLTMAAAALDAGRSGR